MSILRLAFLSCLTGLMFAGLTVDATAAAITLTNGDFETGDLTGWTTFVTTNGTIGTATVVSFDVDGDSAASNAARFNVGEVVNQGDVIFEGGGIFQNFSSNAGLLNVSVDIASNRDGFGANSSAGLFSLLIDGVEIASFDFGPIASITTERSVLAGSTFVTAGNHELRILIGRPFTTSANTPLEFIDDVTLDLVDAAVPEPATLSLLGLGLAGVARRRMKRRQLMRS